MRESIGPNTFSGLNDAPLATNSSTAGVVAPFFSMRKLRLIFNELNGTEEFEFTTFDDFKHQVLNSVAPQLELNKWQAIAARR
ncbi:MAG: hypothetical protein WA981_13330 [Glaciecola sp.]